MSHNEQVEQQQQGSNAKKLRFDRSSPEICGESDAGMGATDSSAASARSVLKTSPTRGAPLGRASSLRRPSETASTHSDAHVQLNPNAEVIEHDGRVTTCNAASIEAEAPVEAVEESAGEVANFLADVGAGVAAAANMSMVSPGAPLETSLKTHVDVMTASAAPALRTTDADPIERFRSLLLQLSSLTLEYQPKDPEQCMIDYLQARLLSSAAVSRASHTGDTATDAEKEATAGAPATTLATDGLDMTTSPDGSTRMNTRSLPTPRGGTVMERLTRSPLLSEVGRTVMTRLAKSLLSAQPDDPEDFLWARLEAQNFGVDAAHSVAFSADGYPVVRPEDPTQVHLLKDIPVTSPGYVVATSLLPLLFAKKPVDPISYLFYHIGSRARLSAAQSMHSSTRPLRYGDEEDEMCNAESCTSREFDDDSDSVDNDAVELISTLGSTLLAPLQRKGSLGSLFDNSATAAMQSLRRRSERSDNARQRLSLNATMSRSSSVRRELAGATRASKGTPAAQLLSTGPSALNGAASSSKRVSIAQQGEKPSSPTRTHHIHFPGPSPNTLHNMESDEYARVKCEFKFLRLRDELRLERLHHDIRVLTREAEYRNRMALLNKTDRMADRAAAMAQEALEEALEYRTFLCAQIDELEVVQERQLRLILQQGCHCPYALSSAGVPSISSPISGHWPGAEARDQNTDMQVPSELDILKKKVELLTMEQARARSNGYGMATGCVANAPHTNWNSTPAPKVTGSTRVSHTR
ncbi:hypothetical protein JKF63_01204 [Porcisia hertigi]|uniref:Uncharacterized protein n=1 Tax=Porcisia hertigi TaxID=2761500 RepID=A0A836ICH9_9TRYP|nr:hypothetical protein JKF63_01204 [Porcisia hertigi]